MGGKSSKAAVPVQATQGGAIGSPVGVPAELKHRGPVHSLCALGEDSILSGGADKVECFSQC
jgi:hypothetical protein